jgi:hypothetical protein
MSGPREPEIDFGDLLVAIATDLEDIRQCIGCGEDSTWAGIFVADDATVSVSAWCDAPDCERDRTVLSAEQTFALPIDHLPALRKPPAPPAVLCAHEHPEAFARRWDELMDELGEWRRGERQP